MKVYPDEHVGILFETRWTPTNITTTSTGWWWTPIGAATLSEVPSTSTSLSWPPASRFDLDRPQEMPLARPPSARLSPGF